jgi:PAS domain S-box-containing protein
MMRNLNKWLIIAIIVILASGMVLTLWTVQREENLLRADLLSKTRLIQAGISTGHVKALTGTEADLESTDYRALKELMMQVKSTDPLIRFVYVLGQQPDGTVIFFIDSEPQGSEDYSPPGQVYTEASAILLNAFASGNETTEGPVTDRWGTWVSGLVPITDSQTGEIIALLGADIDARDWTALLIIASAPAVIAMLLLLLLLLIFYYVLQRNDRERQILTASEAAIKESERRLTDIINFLPDATLVIDKEGKVISWNKAMEEMTGVPADAMLGKGEYEYSIPFYGERRPILIDLIFDENEEIKKKYPFIQKEGNKFFSEIYIQRIYGGKGAYLWFIVAPLYDSRGMVTGAIETIRDITHRKQAEDALQKSEEQFRTVFEKGQHGMVMVDEKFRFLKINPRFCTMLGYSKEELLTMSFTDITHMDYVESDISHLHQLSAGEIPEYTTDKRYIKKNGDEFWASVVASAVRDTDGRFLYYIGLITDITEQKVIEMIQEQYNAEATRHAEDLTRVNDKLNLLNSITRHDILNQLTAILGYLEMMQMKFPDPSLQEYINNEIHAARNIETQINFTKDYQDIGIQSPGWFNVRKIILSNAANLQLSKVGLVVHFDNLEIFADPLLEKVFYTLLENALRHGKTVTRIEFSYRTQDEDLVVVYQDNGEGIPAEYKEAILQRKFFKHTGFGLYLSQTILGITGMTIRENGEPGKGARFEILVPKGAFRFTHAE